MKFKFFLLIFFLLTTLVAVEEVELEEVVNRVDKDAIYIYDYCTGEYMKVKLKKDEAIECRDAKEVDISLLSNKPKVLSKEECEQDAIQVVNITDKKQVLKIFDYSRGKEMVVEISENGTLKCKDIKIIKKNK